MALPAIQIVLRPAPPAPVLPSNTPPVLAQYLLSVQNWCREAERALRELQTALNETRAKVT